MNNVAARRWLARIKMSSPAINGLLFCYKQLLLQLTPAPTTHPSCRTTWSCSKTNPNPSTSATKLSIKSIVFNCGSTVSLCRRVVQGATLLFMVPQHPSCHEHEHGPVVHQAHWRGATTANSTQGVVQQHELICGQCGLPKA